MDVVGNIIVGQYISVKVEEYLPDLILVSFEYVGKLFQGILLDSTKRQIPCGVYTKNFPQPDIDPASDKLYSVKQRYTYFQNTDASLLKFPNHPFKKANGTGKSKNARMTVRLRPRQVLCSNCQSICNEKSENVSSNKFPKPQTSTGSRISAPLNILSNSTTADATFATDINRKLNESRPLRQTRRRVQLYSNNFRSASAKTNANLQTNNPVLVPKLIKLKASDIETATSIGISSLPNETSTSKPIQTQVNLSQCPSNDSDESFDSEGKLPKLKLISGLAKKSKGKIPKVTISTSSIPSIAGESSKECGIRTRSRGSTEDKIDELLNKSSAAKMISSYISSVEPSDNETERIVAELSSEANKVDITKDEKESQPLYTGTAATPSTNEEVSILSLPKLTILPSNSKSETLDTKTKVDKPCDKMNLRKKRSIGSMEDLWDETIFDENKKLKTEPIKDSGSSLSSEECDGGSTDSEKPKTTPILKISFGPGKGMVLKIPAKSTISENDSTESEGQGEAIKKNKNIVAKAARKALKKAKKEAQKKALIGVHNPVFINPKSRFGGKSPMRLGGMSPARLSGFSPGRFGGTSPGRFGGTSPGRFGGTSPGRFGGASPARFGGSSPSVLGGMMSPRGNVEGLFRPQSKKHKHKVKHKKKHKEDRKHKSDENVEPNNMNTTSAPNKEENEPLVETTNMELTVDKGISNIQKVINTTDQPLTNSGSQKQNVLQNTRHKLSISIKRVSNASYVTCDPNTELEKIKETETSNTQSDSELIQKCTNQGTEGTILSSDQNIISSKPSYEENDFNYLNVTPERDAGSDPNQSSDETLEVPDFPCIDTGGLEQGEDAALFLMKLGWHDVDSCEVQEGLFKVGDIVWGKVSNIPWWPAKIIRLKVSKDTCRGQQAQVCWYGSSTSSLLPTESLQPFLKKFHVRYRKKKEGPYQDAVREANIDADQLLNEAEQALSLCESPITASPREVNVVS